MKKALKIYYDFFKVILFCIDNSSKIYKLKVCKCKNYLQFKFFDKIIELSYTANDFLVFLQSF